MILKEVAMIKTGNVRLTLITDKMGLSRSP